MIATCLQKITQDKATGVLIVPIWTTQPWFTGILNLLMDKPLILPQYIKLTADTAPQWGSSPAATSTTSNGLQSLRQSFQHRGISNDATGIILQSWSAGTQKQYQPYIAKWHRFCAEREINPYNPPLNIVLDRGVGSKLKLGGHRLSRHFFTAGLFHRSRVTGHGSRVTGHGSRVTGHGSRVTGHGSRVTGHGSRVTGHGSQVTGHGSRVTGHGSRVITGHRFMSTSTPVKWSLSLQQGIFRVYIFSVGSQALPPCGYCWRPFAGSGGF